MVISILQRTGYPLFRYMLASMTATPVRVTLVALDILAAIDAAPPEDPLWGDKLSRLIGHGSGTAYPALHRLEKAGWIAGRDEARQPDRPRRRFYELTDAGRAGYYRELESRGWRPASSGG
jgi:PadR family transcriptional regulator, regulatory protein PadR